MENIEIIAEFRIDSTIRVIKLLFNHKVYEFPYRLLCQWKEEDWIHILAICEEKDSLFELIFDCEINWRVMRVEEVD